METWGTQETQRHKSVCHTSRFQRISGLRMRFFREIRLVQSVRRSIWKMWNFLHLTGSTRVIEELVMSTGMGGPSTAIAVEELKKAGVKAMIRIGSCGALQPEAKVGDLVLVEATVRDEGTSLGYAPLSYPAVADFELLSACKESAKKQGFSWHMGIGRSHDCLYRDENPQIYEEWARRGVMASDMETASLYVVGRVRGVKTASILNVVAGCKSDVAEDIGRYADGEKLTALGEEHEILTAFEAFECLEHAKHEVDK